MKEREVLEDNEAWSFTKNWFDQRKTSTSSTNWTEVNLWLSEHEIQIKIEVLKRICWMEDVDLLNLEDITESTFLQGILSIMKPNEFTFDNARQSNWPYVQILYKIKHFLDKRKFKAAVFLKDLKNKFEFCKDNEEAKWSVVRLTVFVAFLVSAIKQELNFDNFVSIKPNLIKGLVYSLNEVLLNLDSNWDENSLVYSENQ